MSPRYAGAGRTLEPPPELPEPTYWWDDWEPPLWLHPLRDAVEPADSSFAEIVIWPIVVALSLVLGSLSLGGIQ